MPWRWPFACANLADRSSGAFNGLLFRPGAHFARRWRWGLIGEFYRDKKFADSHLGNGWPAFMRR